MKKEHQIIIKTTKEFKEISKKLADMSGMSLSMYIRFLILEDKKRKDL